VKFIKFSNTYYIVLGTLSFGNISGYDIKKNIEQSTGEFYKINYGQIYPILKSMLTDGSVTLQPNQGENIRNRKMYSLTEKGMEKFLEWLTLPINFDNPSGNELLVKLYFGKYLPANVNIKRIKQFREHCILYLEKMNKLKEKMETHFNKEGQKDYTMIAINHGELMVKAKIEWCNQSLLRLSGQKESGLYS
jgi:DNA-binding PadR family transcriptional regulator